MNYPFITLLTLLAIWSAVWKAVALWKSARNNHLGWFIFILIFNTAGLLPIIYILLFNKPKRVNLEKPTSSAPTPPKSPPAS